MMGLASRDNRSEAARGRGGRTWTTTDFGNLAQVQRPNPQMFRLYLRRTMTKPASLPSLVSQEFLNCQPDQFVVAVLIVGQTKPGGLLASSLIAGVIDHAKVKVPESPSQRAVVVVNEERQVAWISNNVIEVFDRGFGESLRGYLQTQKSEASLLDLSALRGFILARLTNVERRAEIIFFEPIEALEEWFQAGRYLVLGVCKLGNADR